MDVSETKRTPSERRTPERTCVGCGKKGPPAEMVRLVLGPSGEIAADLAGGAFGRGAHVHAGEACLTKAARGGLARSFKEPVRATVSDLASVIVVGAVTRAHGLLLAASRARRLVAGGDLAEGALEASPHARLVVAADAARPEGRPTFHRAVTEGRAMVFGTKRELGALLGQEEVAFCAVTDEKVARELARLVTTLGAVRSLSAEGHHGSRSDEACRSPEGR